MPDTVFLSRGNSPVSSCSDASDLVNLKSDEGWEDVEPDQVSEQIVSLLDDQIFPDVSSMLLHCKEKYNFDFIQVRDGFSLGFYGSIKLVNYIRSEIKAGRQITSDFPKEVLDGDRYLKPVLEDDALLFSLDDLPGAVTNARDDAASASRSEEPDRVAELEQELRKTQTHFSNYKVAVQQILDRQWNDEPGGAVSGEPEEAGTDKDFHYFNSYAYNGMYCLAFISYCSNYV
jgi:type I protein arginine methyltransferase